MKKSLKLLIPIGTFLSFWPISVAAEEFNQFPPCQISQLEPSQQAEAISIAGTRVKLVPPVGFTVSSQFPGYVQESTGASIIVTEFSGSFSEVSASFSNPEKLAQQNLVLLNQEEVIINQQTGLLLQVQQKADEEEFLKWILVLGDEQKTVLIMATLPKILETFLSEPLKASILSAQWNKETIVSPTEGLNFTIVESGNLKFAQRLANILLYTKEGIFPSKNRDDPIFIIGQSVGQAIIKNKEAFSKERLQETASVTQIKIEHLQKVVIDELEGYEIIAQGKDIESGQTMVIYQTLLFLDDNTYYVMQGIVSLKSKDYSLIMFKAMTNSFKRMNINQ